MSEVIDMLQTPCVSECVEWTAGRGELVSPASGCPPESSRLMLSRIHGVE